MRLRLTLLCITMRGADLNIPPQTSGRGRPEIMQSDSILFVGDIQGCADALGRLLKKARFQPDRHRLIPVGDTINRGPRNVEVLQMLQHLGAEPIAGNHELKLLDALRSPERAPWLAKQSVAHDLLPHPHLSRYLDWMESWPVYRETPDWVTVHGGLHPLLPVHETPASFLAFVRICDAQGHMPAREAWNGLNDGIPPGYAPWHSFYKEPRLVIYGHWARQGLHRTPNTLGLDSGCCYGERLTGFWYPDNKLIQVDGEKNAR